MVLYLVVWSACLSLSQCCGCAENDDDDDGVQDKNIQPRFEHLDGSNIISGRKQQVRQRGITCNNGFGIVLNMLWCQSANDLDKNTQPCSNEDSHVCDSPRNDDEMHAAYILEKVQHCLDTVMSAHQAASPHNLIFVTAFCDDDDGNICTT